MTERMRKTAIVTGAAQGIGRAVARRLATDGMAVVLADVQAEKGEGEAATIRTAGGEASFIETDVASPERLDAMVDFALERFGRLDVLVNNATDLRGRNESADKAEPAEWDSGFAVMVRALALASRRAVPAMRDAGGGSIVNIASVHGLLAANRYVVYDTCKHAVIGLTRGMAVDFGPDGIRVNAICPGFICTETRDATWRANHAEALYSENIYPLRRVGRPADIAAAVSFLVSDEAAFITGHALVVDGGLTVQLQDSFGGRVRRFVNEGEVSAPLRTPPIAD